MSTDALLGEAISAASLVLAVLAALYTLWFQDVSTALKLKPETDKNDRRPQIEKTWLALWSKALPLAIATIGATAILFPRGFAIVKEICASDAAWPYDDVKALFILTWALLLLLALVASTQLVGLVNKLVALKYR